jgi:uncharacterized protein YdhG (YjbR/CyaY superfamily)
MESNKGRSAGVDAYIATFPNDVQVMLEQIRATVHAAAPGAEEKISYHMPAITWNGDLIYFAAFKNHIGIFGMGGAVTAYKKELAIYTGPKGNLKFPLDQPLPLDSIRKIVKFRMSENLVKAEMKPAKKKR